MAFPITLDDFTPKVDSTNDVMAIDINELQTAIEAIQSKIGIDASEVTSSLDYLIKAASNPGHTHTAYVPVARTVNTKALSTDIVITPDDLNDTSTTHKFVSATDISNWNGKQDTLGFTPENVANKVTSISGSSTDIQYPSAKLVYDQLATKLATSAFTDAAVTGKLLTGYTSGAGTVAATDTILQAIQKLNGNIGAITLSSLGAAPLRPITAKTALVDADEVTGNDSANTFSQIRTTWTNVKAFLKTYFDGLYQPIISFGAGVLTALGVNIGTAGSVVVNGGALGTPSSGDLTNCTFPTLNQNTSGTASNLSGTPALPNGTTATTQSANDNSTKIATTAYVDSKTSGGDPVGVISIWAAATAPTGYLICDGASLLRAGTYAGLFGIIGTTYGAADGTHFTLPNLKGKVVVGVNSAETEFDVLGETGGEKKHQLTVAELASHTHTYSQQTNGTASNFSVSNYSATTATTGSTGSDTPHNNLQPYISLNYIIKY